MKAMNNKLKSQVREFQNRPDVTKLSRRQMLASSASLLVSASAGAIPFRAFAQSPLRRKPDVIYVATPEPVVNAMLKAANVSQRDIVYDLGCGDGRIVIAAAKEYGARGVGIEIDPQRVKDSRENAKRSAISMHLEIRQQDLFESDFGDASIVTLFLLPELNLKVRSRLWKDLRVGTRVVSHEFDMGTDWTPEQQIAIDGRRIWLWTINESVKRRASRL